MPRDKQPGEKDICRGETSNNVKSWRKNMRNN